MFDLRRFGRLVRAQWAEQGRGWLWFLVVGVAVHACVWLLITTGGKHAEEYTGSLQMSVYSMGYVITGALFALRYHATLASRDVALTFLMRPASALEKALLAFVVVAVLYPVGYTIAFQICNLPAAWLSDRAWSPGSGRAYDVGPYIPFTVSGDAALEFQLVFGTLAIQALVLAGALYFHRLAWLKTVVGLFVLTVLALPLLAMATGASVGLLFLTGIEGSVAPSLEVLRLVVWLGVPALFWVATYRFLRERQLQ